MFSIKTCLFFPPQFLLPQHSGNNDVSSLAHHPLLSSHYPIDRRPSNDYQSPPIYLFIYRHDDRRRIKSRSHHDLRRYDQTYWNESIIFAVIKPDRKFESLAGLITVSQEGKLYYFHLFLTVIVWMQHVVPLSPQLLINNQLIDNFSFWQTYKIRSAFNWLSLQIAQKAFISIVKFTTSLSLYNEIQYNSTHAQLLSISARFTKVYRLKCSNKLQYLFSPSYSPY